MKKKDEKKYENKKEIKKVDKVKSKNKKDSRKVVEVKSNNSEWNKVVKVVVWVALIFGFFYLLTYVLVGDLSFGEDEEKTETTIQYDEILAGSSFGMNASKYLVIYYDKSSDDADEIMSAIYTYNVSLEPLTVYTVDLSNALNNGVIVEDVSNKNPKNASELAINGPTLIRFRDGEVREYIEGIDGIVDYLSE